MSRVASAKLGHRLWSEDPIMKADKLWMAGMVRLLVVVSLVVVSSGSPGLAAPLDIRLLEVLEGAPPGAMIPVIVTFQGGDDLEIRSPGPRQARRAELVRGLKSRAERAQRPARAFLRSRGVGPVQELWINNSLAVTASPETVRELAARPEVENVRLEEVLRVPQVTPAQITGAAEFNVNLVNAPALWVLGIAGQGVTVAVMDSGVDVNHPDLGPRWRGGANSWFDPNGEHPLVPFDQEGHGTAVMGTLVGGNTDGSYIGVAPEAQWIAVKIFNDAGEASESAIHQGFQWLLDPDGNPNSDDAPDVVSNSWGFEEYAGACVELFRSDVQALKAAGIAIVFAAGNTGPNAGTSVAPANYPEAFAVGAVGTIQSPTEIAASSARGPSPCDSTVFPEVVAPGFFVKTADLTLGGISPDAYVYVSGTSIAAPHVAGVMALLLSALPDLTVSELEQALLRSARDLGATGPDNDYGYGLVDALAALDWVDARDLSNTPPPPALLQTPADGSTGLSTTLTLSWRQPPDADGDPVANTVQLDTSPHFLNPLVIATNFGANTGLLLGTFGGVACLLPLGLPGKRKRGLLVVTAGLVIGMLVLVSCGGGGSSSDPNPPSQPVADLQSQPVANLAAGTTYYWRVLSQDSRGGTSASGVFSFTTAP